MHKLNVLTHLLMYRTPQIQAAMRHPSSPHQRASNSTNVFGLLYEMTRGIWPTLMLISGSNFRAHGIHGSAILSDHFQRSSLSPQHLHHVQRASVWHACFESYMFNLMMSLACLLLDTGVRKAMHQRCWRSRTHSR